MLYFQSRAKARAFANGKKKVIDLKSVMGTCGAMRWAVKVL